MNDNSYVVDAGGRWHWIDSDFRDVKVGDKFVMTISSRWSNPVTYSKPMTVTRHTDLTLWLDSGDGKELRVAKTTGKIHGERYSSRWVKPYTAKMKKKIKESKRAAKAAAAEAKSEADAEETRKREKYCATKITNEAVQEILRPIRDLAEAYSKKLEDIFIEIGDADADNPSKLTTYLGWNEDRATNIGDYHWTRDALTKLHDRLVNTVLGWGKGVSYEMKAPGKDKYTFSRDLVASGEDIELANLLKTIIAATLDEATANYFNGHNQDEKWRYMFIHDLRDHLDLRWDFTRVDTVQEKEDA